MAAMEKGVTMRWMGTRSASAVSASQVAEKPMLVYSRHFAETTNLFVVCLTDRMQNTYPSSQGTVTAVVVIAILYCNALLCRCKTISLADGAGKVSRRTACCSLLDSRDLPVCVTSGFYLREESSTIFPIFPSGVA